MLNDIICIKNASEQFIIKKEYNFTRKATSCDFLIEYIDYGKGYYKDKNSEVIAENGSILLYLPNKKGNFSIKREDSTHLMSVHFSGSECENLLSTITENSIVKISNQQSFKYLFEKLIDTYEKKLNGYQTICSGYLLIIIQTVLNEYTSQAKYNNTANIDSVSKVIEIMKNEYNQPINLPSYASICGVSESRFAHLFKEKTGFSPYNYQIMIRIEKAKELLTYTALSISQVSEQVGFDDCSYFCRIFKKYVKISPYQYKNRI